MAVNRLNRCRSFVIVAALSILLQGQLVRPNPTGHQLVKRQSPPNSPEAVFVNDLGDLLSSLISTGLRGAAAFLTSGSEATQKMAVAVGSAALPPLLNVTRTYNRVQESSRNVLNSTNGPLAPVTDGNIRTLTRRINEGVQPAVKTFGEAFNQTFLSPSGSRNGLFGALLGNGRGSASGSNSNTPPRTNPFDTEIPDVIDWDN